MDPKESTPNKPNSSTGRIINPVSSEDDIRTETASYAPQSQEKTERSPLDNQQEQKVETTEQQTAPEPTALPETTTPATASFGSGATVSNNNPPTATNPFQNTASGSEQATIPSQPTPPLASQTGQQSTPETTKTYFETFLLALLLGYWGADRFYLGYFGTGIAKIVTFGGFGIWWLIDVILSLLNKRTEKDGTPLANYESGKKPALIISIVYVAMAVVLPILTFVILWSVIATLFSGSVEVETSQDPGTFQFEDSSEGIIEFESNFDWETTD